MKSTLVLHALSVVHQTFVLKAAHDDRGCDLKLIRESLYVRDLKPSKLRLVALWNEHSRREPIRFAFESFCLNVCGWIGDCKAVDEDALFPMERNVCRFMEEAEPEDVLPVITEAELKQCLGGAQPSRRSVRT